MDNVLDAIEEILQDAERDAYSAFIVGNIAISKTSHFRKKNQGQGLKMDKVNQVIQGIVKAFPHVQWKVSEDRSVNYRCNIGLEEDVQTIVDRIREHIPQGNVLNATINGNMLYYGDEETTAH